MEHIKRRRNPALWHHVNRVLTALIIAGVLLFAAVNFYPQWTHRNHLAQQLRDEQAKLRTEQLLQKKREREVSLLQNDPGYIEAVARDKLGVMKDGETIFRLDGSRAQPAAAAPEPRKKPSQ